MKNLSFRTQLIIVLLFLAALSYGFNFFTYRYHASSYIDFAKALGLMPGVLLYVFSRYIETTKPYLAFLLKALWLIILVSLVINIITVTIQYTPFALQDKLLHEWDMVLGFDTNAWVNWTFQYPYLVILLKMAYWGMIQEVFLAPLVLALLQQRRRFEVYLNICLFASLIGYIIYYFFPTTTPASVLSNPHFTDAMRVVPQRFYDLHHYIPNNDMRGGIIGFPSFHVIWAIATTYSFRKIKPIFYFLLVWNSFDILATLLLGWHFLPDVIGGAVLVTIAIYIAEKKAVWVDQPLKGLIRKYKVECR